MIRLFLSLVLCLYVLPAMADDSLHCKVSDKEYVDMNYNAAANKVTYTWHKDGQLDQTQNGYAYVLISKDGLKTGDGREMMGAAKEAPDSHPVVPKDQIQNIDSIAEFVLQRGSDASLAFVKYYDKDQKVLGTFGVAGWAAVYCDGKNEF